MTPAERADYIRAVHDRLAELNDAPDLSVEQLSTFTTEDLISYAELYGVVVDEDMIDAEINASMGTYLDDMDRGVQFDAAKQEDLAARIEAATARVTTVTTKANMRDMRATILEQEDPRAPDAQLYEWIARLRRSCRSCEERHGEVKTMDEWRAIGLPGSGSTQCGGNCECELSPLAASDATTRTRNDARNAEGPRRRIVAEALG